MGRSRRGRVASGGGASSVVGERGTMTEKRNLYLYLYLYLYQDSALMGGMRILSLYTLTVVLRPYTYAGAGAATSIASASEARVRHLPTLPPPGSGRRPRRGCAPP